MRILISGASGMIGSALVPELRRRGHVVTRLVRGSAAGGDEVSWDPSAASPGSGSGRGLALSPSVVDETDAVINLSGASISKMPWSRRYRDELVASRLAATRALTGAMAEASTPPAVLVNASAVGFYGSRPGELLTEDSSAGDGFLSELVRRWEEAAHAAPAGVRVVTARTGIVLGSGGALAPLRRIAGLGLAGPIGSGRQRWPWISLRDEVAAFVHLVEGGAEGVTGPINLVGPTPATAGELVRALARLMHRPYWAPLPAFLVSAVLGEAGRELLLADQHVAPVALLGDGFVFADATMDAALAAAVRSR